MPDQRKLEKFSTNDFNTRLGQARCSECMETKVHCYQHRVENNWILCSDCRSAYCNELCDKKKRPFGPRPGGHVQSKRRKF